MSKPFIIINPTHRYGSCNLQFGLYYDKVFKKEYMPSRIRYNQFFFYSIFAYFIYTVHTKVSNDNVADC
jgi:hypothetical protein